MLRLPCAYFATVFFFNPNAWRFFAYFFFLCDTHHCWITCRGWERQDSCNILFSTHGALLAQLKVKFGRVCSVKIRMNAPVGAGISCSHLKSLRWRPSHICLPFLANGWRFSHLFFCHTLSLLYHLLRVWIKFGQDVCSGHDARLARRWGGFWAFGSVHCVVTICQALGKG